MLLKELMEQNPNYFKSDNIKTHIRPNGVDMGITGFYNKNYLLENFANNEAEIVYYEKDYGDGAIAIRDFLAINVKEEK